MLRLLVSLMLLVSCPAYAAIVFDSDADSTAQDNLGSPFKFSWSHTATGNDIVVVTCVNWLEFTEADQGVSTVTFDGNTMTFLRQDESTGGGAQSGSEIWYYVLGTGSGGAVTVEVTMNGTNNGIGANSSTFTGVSQSSPIDVSGGAGGFANSPAGDHTENITTNTNGAMLIASISNKDDATSIIPDANQVEILDLVTGGTTETGTVGVSYKTADTAGTFAMGWTSLTTDDVSLTIIALKPLSSSDKSTGFVMFD